MAVTGMDIVEAARKFAGAPYHFWTGAFPEYGPPGYMDWLNPGDYMPGYVQSEGVHCAGLVNLARMECGLQPVGLTKAYSEWLWSSGKGESFNPDPNTPGVPGALCVKPWEPGTPPGQSEGHIAIYTDAHTLIQAVVNPGVYEGEQDYDSYAWAGYTTYGLMPDVDYSGVADRGNINKEDVWYVAVDSEGYMRVKGPDWSGGWYDAGWKWHAPESSPKS
jgi:hypothetical protein